MAFDGDKEKGFFLFHYKKCVNTEPLGYKWSRHGLRPLTSLRLYKILKSKAFISLIERIFD